MVSAPLPLDFARSSSVRTATSAPGRRNTEPFRRVTPLPVWKRPQVKPSEKHADGGPDGRRNRLPFVIPLGRMAAEIQLCVPRAATFVTDFYRFIKMKFDYDQIYDFNNLYRAYLASRRSKRETREVIQFEMNTGPNLCKLQEELRSEAYQLSGYYHFTIHDPKVREIYALHYRDRILQHSLCDNVLAPYFETHLIYDNAACRKDKGTLFAMNRLNGFMHDHFRKHGKRGYFLKCDVRKFFDSIDHDLLKQRLETIVDDKRTLTLLYHIIDSYEVTPGRGIPMGNQTSQWFALFYLDPLDRLVKEKLRIRYYTRYMDDCILLHHSKQVLEETLAAMRALLDELHLEFNDKTQIFPIEHGVEYLGWRYYLTDTGAVARRLKKHSKIRWKHRLRKLKALYAGGSIDIKKIHESTRSFANHMSYGNTWEMYHKEMSGFILQKNSQENS